MIDKYGRNIDYLRISVTELCNLRCQYCMPEAGIVKRPHDEMMTLEEIYLAAEAAAELGVKKIRITGGEPLVKHGIVEICKNISDIDGIEEVCMTTNATLLPRYAKELKEAGLDRLNISLDSLDEKKYKEMTRLGDVKEALEGIEAAEKAGFKNTKINVVLTKGFNDNEIKDFVDLTKEKDIEVRFIELMPIGEGIGFNRDKFVSADEVLNAVPELESLEKEDGVARLYALPGAKGRIGLIRPISCEFCQGCNKIRLTSDGKIKPCLHTDQEVLLKGKDKEGMKRLIKKAILDKPEKREDFDESNPSKAGRDMNQIGG